MEKRERRAWLRKMVETLRARPGTAAAVLAKLHYPGGIAGLEGDWRSWLEEKRRDHRYALSR